MTHPMSESEFSFDLPSSPEKIRLRKSEAKLTSYGGLASFAAFLNKTAIVDKLVKACPIERTSPNATPVKDIVIGFMLSILTGANRFRDIIHIQNDAVLGELFGIERRIPSDDAIRRFFQQFNSEQAREWISHAYKWLYDELNIAYILDWDSTVITRYGEQEGAEIGYNPHQPGRPSHHPLVASIAGTRFCLGVFQREGNSSSCRNWTESMEYLLSKLPHGNTPLLNRGDIGFGNEEIMAWHEKSADRPNYLFKIRKSKRIKDVIEHTSDKDWIGAQHFNASQVIEKYVRLSGWSKSRRVVITRQLISKETPEESGTLFGICNYKYQVYITNLSSNQLSFWQLIDLYNQRADCENIFDDLKNHWGMSGFCSKYEVVTELASQFSVLSYNIWSLYSRFFNVKNHREAKHSRKNFMQIVSKWTVSSRQKTLLMSIPERIMHTLSDGYKRLYRWLSSTAPQLNLHMLTCAKIPDNLMKLLPYERQSSICN